MLMHHTSESAKSRLNPETTGWLMAHFCQQKVFVKIIS